mgnify:FL=1
MEWTENIKNAYNFRTGLSMRANGTLLLAREMGEEYRCGQTDQDMKDTGKAIKQTAEGDLYTQTGMFMKESGKTTKVKDMECTCILMGLSTKENGLRTSKRGMD